MPTSTPKIYRDDDISIHTDICLFKKIHDKFIERKLTHTVAVCMKDLWQNQGLFYYLNTAPYLKVELHGWEHKDYSKLGYEECYADLEKSIEYWNENCNRMTHQCKPLTTFFAPWNRDGDNIRKACKVFGLSFCNVRKGMWQEQEIHSFHFWAFADKEFDIDKL